MRIVLVTFGSRGDVQPMLVLGRALRDAGHDVLLLGPPENAALAEHHGCPFRALGSDVQASTRTMPTPATQPIAATRYLVRLIHTEIANQLRELPDVLRGADLVLGATFVHGVPTVAEQLSVPYRFVGFCPQMMASGAHPHLSCRRHGGPRWWNRFTWWLFGRLGDLADASLRGASRPRDPPGGGRPEHLRALRSGGRLDRPPRRRTRDRPHHRGGRRVADLEAPGPRLRPHLRRTGPP